MDEYENIECFKKNKRKYRKCLKNFLNGLRQKHGHNVFKTIVKYKHLFNVNNDTAYQVANDLYETNVFPATDFLNAENNFVLPMIDDDIEVDDEVLINNTDFHKFTELLMMFLGKNIKVVYIPNDDSDFKYEFDYAIPINAEAFHLWWDGRREWDWRVNSDETLFTLHNGSGKVYITESIVLTASIIQQSYLDNKTQNCIFDPILTICNNNSVNPTLASSTQTKFNRVIKKIYNLMKFYRNGVPEEKLDEVCKHLMVKLTLKRPFSNKTMVYGTTDNKSIMCLKYINTRLNHVEVEGKYYNTDKPEYIDEFEFNKLYQQLKGIEAYFIYQMNMGKVYSIKTIDNSYKIKTNEYDVYKKFEKKYNLNRISICDEADELLSKFIRTGCHACSSKINDRYRQMLPELQSIYKEVDCIKAFTQFINCPYYEGFLGKISDFRQTDKIEGIGYYLITNLDWTNANTQIKEIQKVFSIFIGRNVYASPILKYMMTNGVTFKIKGGCWGIRHDFVFDESMYEKVKDTNTSHYAKWTGMMYSHNPYSIYYMNTRDTEYAQHIAAECDTADYFEKKGHVRFGIKRSYQPHKSHISGFIYAYQIINLIEQLNVMDISKVIRINTDGIKYLDHEFVKSPIFRVETKLNKDSFTNDDRNGGFITNTSNCDRNDWLRFHYHFISTPTRTHYDNELFIGQGGGGKTYKNLVDTGLIRALYVAPSYKLTRSKQVEVQSFSINLDTHVLANLLSENKYDEIINRYSTIIIDEASMVNEELRETIFEKFKCCKLIFCGDIGFQAPPINGSEIDMTQFKKVTEVVGNHRCKCELLDELIQRLRNGIKNKEQTGMKYVKYIQLMSQEDVLNIYETKDIILTYKKVTIEMYNELIDKEKYLVTKSCKNFSRGEVFIEQPKTKYVKKTNAFTTHSVQGETFLENIFIDIELVYDLRLFYTAVSRAKYLNQVFIITRPKKNN